MTMNYAWRDANNQPVEYDGSPIDWRISSYAVVVQQDSVLLMRDKNNYLYTVPGGGVELEESLETGLVRELQEEMGAQIAVGSLLDAKEDWFYHAQEKRFYHAVLLFYEAKLIGELGRPSDPKVTFTGFVPLAELSFDNTNPLVWEVLVEAGYLKPDQA